MLTPQGKLLSFGFAGLLILGLLWAIAPVTVVDNGYRGVKKTYGKVEDRSLTPGLYFYNPIMSDIEQLDVRTLKSSVALTAYTADVQQADVEIVVNYNLDPASVHEMYQTVGRDWDEKLVPQVVSGAYRAIVGKWDAVDLVANQDKAQQEIISRVTTALAAKKVAVTDLQFGKIKFSPDFETAVEAKVIAIQNAEQEKNKTVQVQEQANQKVIAATAEAESMRIRARALESNPKLTEWAAVEKWDGKLPTYMLGGNTTPFINLNK